MIKNHSVLNLIINGLPSISGDYLKMDIRIENCFKPYYKWITFNILLKIFKNSLKIKDFVLNLIINGLPSILCLVNLIEVKLNIVLNLIINGLPSIL